MLVRATAFYPSLAKKIAVLANVPVLMQSYHLKRTLLALFTLSQEPVWDIPAEGRCDKLHFRKGVCWEMWPVAGEGGDNQEGKDILLETWIKYLQIYMHFCYQKKKKRRRNKPQVFGVLPCMLFEPLQLLWEPAKCKQERGSSFIFMRMAKPQRPRALSGELQEVLWWQSEAWLSLSDHPSLCWMLLPV